MRAAPLLRLTGVVVRAAIAVASHRRRPRRDPDSALADRLRAALAAGDVTAAFQPVVDLRDDTIVGVEALARWHDPVLGAVSPARFVAVAEQSELILDLTDHMLDLTRGCQERMRAAGFELEVAVNVSARFLDDRLVGIVDAHRGEGLVLEITETGLITDAAVAAESLGRLVRSGVRVALDDFGVGRSSLGYLVDLPVSTLKIDRSFVARMDDGSASAAVIRSTIELGRLLGLEVVAEGVERDDQLDVLRAIGCDRVQGYVVAPPLAEPDLLALLQRDRTEQSLRSSVTQMGEGARVATG